MRINIIVLATLAVFFYLCAAAYTLWHMAVYNGAVEWTGSLGLGLTAVLATLIGFYLVLLRRGQGGELAMDRHDGELDEDDPEQGHFAPWSWWPISLAAAIALLFLAFAGPTFVLPIGVGILIIALVGWVYEHYRGNFSR